MEMHMEAEVIGKRWSYCADGYDEIIQSEFSDELTQKWSILLKEHAPCETGQVLDIGTGPGFFSILMSHMGWDAVGVDCAEKMIETAEKNARKAGADARFYQMDNHALNFPDNTFDYIIGRNVTWILYEPEKAFQEWLRVLKPGGRLLYLDANWHYKKDRELLKAIQKDEQEYRKLYGMPINTYKGDERTEEEFKNVLYFNDILRPKWDQEHLPEFGFRNINVIQRVNENVYSQEKQLLYRSIPLFLVTADKPYI